MTQSPLTPEEIETLRKALHPNATHDDADNAFAILDRLTPKAEPEVDEATKIWRETFARGYSAVGFNMSAANVRDGRHDVDPKFAEAAISYLREVLAAKDAERDALAAENFRLAAGVCIYPNGEGLLGDDHGNSFCSVEQERKRLDERETDLMADLNKAESDLATLRAENERLKAAYVKYVAFDQPEAAERNTAEPATDTTPDVDAPVDSGMNAEAVGQAELFWAQLPTNRKWASILTHEKALVCHLLSTYRIEAEARGRREALEMTNAKWLVLADIVREADSAEDAARELKRLMTGGK